MIKALNTFENRIPEPITLAEMDFENPFYEGLTYNAAARGVWNIVHTGMLIPESNQVYVCAQGCLRGVVLTAAEMNAMERMSWVALREEDMWNGEMESRVIEGTRHIVEQLEVKPRCVLIYLSCMHMFEGCDFKMITDELSEMFPDIDFVECYMIPTMRKTMSPDSMMKISLYEPVKILPKENDLVALIGSNLPFDKASDIAQLIRLSGKRIWDIADCETYNEYLKLGAAPLAISTLSVADTSAKQLTRRLNLEWLKLPIYFNESRIDSALKELGTKLGLDGGAVDKFIEESRSKAYADLKKARAIVGDTPIAIDYTAYPYILELAELLTANDFHVERIYSDSFPKNEGECFERLKEVRPDIKVYPTIDPAMRFAAGAAGGSAAGNSSDEGEFLAIGQKAAYFTATTHFVDIVEGGGTWGYQAISRLAELMIDARENPKDTKKTISHKGWGCESCL